MKRSILAATLGILVANNAFAQLTTITDTTLGTSTRDGTLNAGEYGSLTYFSGGVNSGFGNVLFGSGGKLYWDSSLGGALNLGLQLGGGTQNGNDAGVIYIDSVAGGFNNTTTINDIQDGGRAAISGNGSFGGSSELTFASGFNADYAISIQSGFAGLFQLASGGSGSLIFVTSLSLTPTGAGPQQREGALLLSNVGLSFGGSFKLNPDNAFRSNELNGDAYAGGNIGQSPFTVTGYNVFQSVPEPSSLTLLALGGLCAARLWHRRRA
ncbi:MAG: PEP-CTERM sorting domain-containing protein [Pedosphaera sp.]|nr:PEP-CTERM sorting domain-containing protein [Pedosphaera sp.]